MENGLQACWSKCDEKYDNQTKIMETRAAP